MKDAVCYFVDITLLWQNRFSSSHNSQFLFLLSTSLCFLMSDCIIDHRFGDWIWLCSSTDSIIMRGQLNMRSFAHWRGSIFKQTTEVWPPKNPQEYMLFLKQE